MMNETLVKRGTLVKIEGKVYTVTNIENYGFFVKGRMYIVLWTDEYEVVNR